jgi:prepilin signal peptidase PulO-like enzyme (type II secretory pathway)
VDLALLLLAVPICVADCGSFVIPNVYNKILFIFAAEHLSIYGFGDLKKVAFSASLLVVLLIFKVGMGDIKLLAIILITHSFSAVDYLGYVFLLAMVHIVVLAGITRKIPSKIPLAPSIFIGLSTYLATR